MKKITAVVVLFCIMTACKKEQAVTKDTVYDSITETTDSAAVVIPADSTAASGITLEKFGFPPEVEGCSCYFAENEADFEKQKFVYVDDYGNNAFIKISGKTIKIPMEEGDFDPANFSKTVENNDYSVEMSGKKIDEGVETMMFRGNMKVTDRKTNKTVSMPLYGECGC